jgi:hypothetical protein
LLSPDADYICEIQRPYEPLQFQGILWPTCPSQIL